MDVLSGVRAPLRGTVQVVPKMLDAGNTALTRDRARLGGDSLLATVLTALGDTYGDDVAVDDESDAGDMTSAAITRGLLAGTGRFTRTEVLDAAGIPLDVGRRLWRALGFAEVADDQRVFTSADAAALSDVSGMITAGIVDADGAVAMARPFGQLLSRLAAAHTSFISEVMGKRLGEDYSATEPPSPEQLSAQAVQITHELLPVLERTTLYVWRRHMATAAGRAVLLPSAEEIVNGEDSRPMAVGFVDLSGFTQLSRTLSVAELSTLLSEFEAQVSDTVVSHHGRVIKNVGDEVMFISDDPAAAAAIAMELVEHIGADERLPAAHAGLAYGPVLQRNGDVFGPVVNIAARITSLARRGTVRVDESMTESLSSAMQFQVSRRAPRRVTGYPQLRSYRLRRRTSPAARR
ncbi:adenylate/guanylate cyclase domain-containing protein [Mycobacterium yunnanensis]|uniref:Adenylate/guanylate cyclase domain-containing protein n=1 Tax=Mycobacterium yunnanensis TaxID=368477 RepID=A0A9X2YIF5_9MYCO|nr:adenylate/guanylate cyclase domain-containing protein [Mycobacterium yunnanensis]MCV7419847.1 adenylate/guanylate cyclase domain-containing protein [Mycobacterium yunnanensis]